MQQVEKIEKPWGYELLWALTSDYVAKILFVKKGESLSLQYHTQKEETMFLESGECELLVGKTDAELTKVNFQPGTAYHIPPGLRHRITALTDCRIFEVSTPYLSDVVRLEDKYGRATV